MSSTNAPVLRRRFVAIAVLQLTALVGLQVAAFAFRDGKEIGDYCYNKYRGSMDINQCVEDACNGKYGLGTPQADQCTKNGKREARRRLYRIHPVQPVDSSAQ